MSTQYDGDVAENQFVNRTDLTYFTLTNCNSIGDYGFFNCSNLEQINLPSTLQTIGVRAFSDCKKLQRITIPDSVKSIGNFGFSYCVLLTDITFPANLESIGGKVFHFDIALEMINLTQNLKTIGTSAPISDSNYFTFKEYFDSNINDCDKCTIVFNNEFAENDKIYFGSATFAYAQIDTVLPNNLVFIGAECFTYSLFYDIEIPKSVETIGKATFSFATFHSVSFPEDNNITKFETNIFLNAAAFLNSKYQVQ